MESKCILLLPWRGDEDDKDSLIRASLAEPEPPEWWKSLQLDGLVLYSWALPKYTKVARAVHEAGIKVMLHMDRGLCLLPEWDASQGMVKNVVNRLKMVVFNLLCARHMRYVDCISGSLPLIELLKKAACILIR